MEGEKEDIMERLESGNQSKVTQRKKKKSNAALCGSPTISPVKSGEGLLAKPCLGEVREVLGRQGGQERVIRQADLNNKNNVSV